MMVMCGDESPVIASICDCTDNMSEAGKKNASYITEKFKIKVNDFDETLMLSSLMVHPMFKKCYVPNFYMS